MASIWKREYRMSGKVLAIFPGLQRLQVLSKCGFLKALLNLCKLSKDDSLFQVCMYSLPSILRQLGIFVEHVENMPGSLVIFLSIHRLHI